MAVTNRIDSHVIEAFYGRIKAGNKPEASTPGMRGEISELGFLWIVLAGYSIILGLLFLSSGAWVGWGLLIIPNAWLLVLSLAWLLRKRPRWTIPCAGRSPKVTLAAGFAVVAITAIWFLFVQPSRGVQSFTTDPHVLQYLLLLVLVPVAEEIYFRGFLMHHLASTIGRPGAAVLTTVLFALLHFPQGAMLPMAVLGALTAVMTIAYGGVLAAVFVHMAWNVIALMASESTNPSNGMAVTLSISAMLAIVLLHAWRPDRRRYHRHGAGHSRHTAALAG